MSGDLLGRLLAAGTPPELVGEVAMRLGQAEADRKAIEDRRASDRARKAKSRDVTGQNVTPVTKRDETVAKDARTCEPVRAETQPTKIDYHPSTTSQDGLKKRAKGKTRISEDAQPDDKDRAAAVEHSLDGQAFRTQWVKFRDYHLSKGSQMADWHAAWRNWLRSPYQQNTVLPFERRSQSGPPWPDQRHRREDPTMQAGLELLQELRARQ